MKYQVQFIPLLIMMVLLSSCSSNKVEVKAQEVETEEPQIVTPEAEISQPVYVYKNQVRQNPEQIILKINGDPLLLSNGYLRLVGVVCGKKPLALVEIAGRGRLFEEEDEIEGYLVDQIFNRSIKIKLNRREDK